MIGVIESLHVRIVLCLPLIPARRAFLPDLEMIWGTPAERLLNLVRRTGLALRRIIPI
jgi:hypothetical protein